MAEIAMKTPSIGSVHFISLAMIFFCCKDSKPKGKYSIGVLWMHNLQDHKCRVLSVAAKTRAPIAWLAHCSPSWTASTVSAHRRAQQVMCAGTAGAVCAGTVGYISAGTAGAVSAGTAGTAGAVSAGTAGAVSAGTAGAVCAGTVGDVSAGTAGAVSAGTAGDVSAGTAGDVSAGTAGDVCAHRTTAGTADGSLQSSKLSSL
eukprot:1156851-Pelagomonas_calceolata.AAC.5